MFFSFLRHFSFMDSILLCKHHMVESLGLYIFKSLFSSKSLAIKPLDCVIGTLIDQINFGRARKKIQ
ncbi:hypothetical protein EB796_013642 [Bugula neritina]|uniref:Uncharacterized protein n=1 Tax=Bugula neritina TaxID=10212 RepID=A0A7J7JQ08_BUGNE|nr:hypothetical protein EB796_013642 [Bugula neritina]